MMEVLSLAPDTPVKVSVLVAARNEEKNILRCLQSLSYLDFPAEQIEILIGDDDSNDATGDLTRRFIEGKPHFRYIKIAKRVAGLKGKANVLAQLSHEAKGTYFFYCDADIAVKPSWITEMLAHFQPGIGTVVGLTRMTHTHFLADLLSMEWLFALAVTRFWSYFKVPVTGMGNNMAVTREAYFKTGGYEQIGFSVVEDYTLFMAIVRAGYGFEMAFRSDIINISEPVNTFPELLKQRKRLMQGVMESFWFTKWSLIVITLIVPFLLILAIWNPEQAFTSLWQYYAFITTLSLISIILLKQWDLWKAAMVFWFYMVGIGCIMLVNHFLPGKMVWKGREY